jgi:diguanylate cyclase (GGDEF)-like protein
MAVRSGVAPSRGSAGADPLPSALTGGRLAVAALALALVYAALYQLVDLETSFGDSTTGVVFWPAAGVTVSVLILRARQEWPAYFVAIVAADGVTSLLGGAGVWSSLGSGLANAAEATLSAVLVGRWLGRVPDLSRRRDLRVFIVAAACIGPLLGAAIGAGFPWPIGETPLWPRLGRWYIGDAVGVLVFAPLIISVARPPAKSLSLTRLANRRLLLERLDHARRRMGRVHTGIGLVYADLDGFKQVNDVHGHAAGDDVLVATAQRLSAMVRGSDTVARRGGDEFVVLLDDLPEDLALQELMGRMSRAIEEPIALAAGPTVKGGASLGFAVTHDADEDPDTFLERADHAMYEVKRAGRGSRRPALA